MVEVFEFTSKTDSLKNYVEDLFNKEVVKKGLNTIINLRDKKPGSLLDFYSSQENSSQNTNPYALRILAKHLAKQNSSILTSSNDTVSSLIYYLSYMILYFQEQKGLTIKLLKTMLKLIGHVRKNLSTFKTQVKSIVQNHVIKFISKQIDYAD